MSFRKSSFKQTPMEATGSFTGTFSGSVEGTIANATSASFATSASHAVTASFALNGGGGGGSLTVTTYSFWDADVLPVQAIDLRNDEFDSASLNSRWTIVNQGDVTYSIRDSLLEITDPTLDFIVHTIVQAPSGSSYTIRGKFSYQGLWTQQGWIGLFLRVASSENMEVYAIGHEASQPGITLFTFSNPTTFGATIQQHEWGGVSDDLRANKLDATSWVYLEIEVDQGAIRYRNSLNGLSWFDWLTTRTTGSFLGGAPDEIGIWTFADTGNDEFTGSCDWFRFTTGTRGEDLNGGLRSVITNVTLT